MDYSKRLTYIISLFICLISCSEADIQELSGDEYVASYDTFLNKTSEYFVVVGDIQAYTSSSRFIYYYDMTMKWMMEEIACGTKIQDVLQVGDITQSNSHEQWGLFYKYTKELASLVPFFVCIGNHDYLWSEESKIKNRNSTRINEYAHFPLTDNNIVDYYSSNSLENYVAQLSDSSKTKLLVLEFGPRKEVLQWAKDYVKTHVDEHFILMTHAWLRGNGQRISMGSNIDLQLDGYSSYCTPEDIWISLVKPNNNIICVICGHDGFFSSLFSKNEAGREVPQILFNLQEQRNGGDGLVQLWEFPSNSNNVIIRIYDTIHRRWHLENSTSVTFEYKY